MTNTVKVNQGLRPNIFIIVPSKSFRPFQAFLLFIEEYKADFTKLYNEAEQALLRLSSEFEDIINNRTSEHKWIAYFKEHNNIESLSRAMLVKLIDKIFVHEGNRIDIKFRYQNQFEKAADTNPS